MFLGIDIGGTTTKLGVTDGGGTILSESSFHTTAFSQADNFLEALDTEVTALISSLDNGILGIGLGAPSANYRTGIIENAANLGWKGKLNIKSHLEKSFGCEVLVTNDANLPAIGEMTYGGAQGMRNFITISLGTGLGSGIVCNGQLVAGHHGMAGEVGHITAKVNGRTCGCGRKGCLETYVSATGLKRTVFELLADHHGDSSELENYTFNQLTAERITGAAIEGDPIAIRAYQFTGEILGMKLADLVCITDPQAVFLVGGMAHAGELLFTPTRKALNKHMLNNFESQLKVLPSNLPLDRLSLLGACGLIAVHGNTSSGKKHIGINRL